MFSDTCLLEPQKRILVLQKPGELFSKGGVISGTQWKLIWGVNCGFENNLKIASKAENAQKCQNNSKTHDCRH